MKRNSVLLPLMATLGASALVLGGCVATAEGFPESSSTSQPSETMPPPAEIPDPTVEGTDASVAWEALMGPDGEYAAAAMYQAVIDEFGSVEPYVTIKAGEERHIDALTRQLERYGMDVPDNPYLGEVSAPADLQLAADAWAEVKLPMSRCMTSCSIRPTIQRCVGCWRISEGHLSNHTCPCLN